MGGAVSTQLVDCVVFILIYVVVVESLSLV